MKQIMRIMKENITTTDKLKKLFSPKHIVESKNVNSWIECGDNQPVSSDKLYFGKANEPIENFLEKIK